MVGIGETYLPAFVLALGHGRVAAGLIATLPPVTGALLQLCGPAAVRRMQSHRRWVVLSATIQALSFLPLMAAALAGRLPLPLVFLCASLYWGFGMAAGPAWNTWIGRIIPPVVRARFFARRARAGQAALLGGVLLGGLLLHEGARHSGALRLFAVLFAVAGASRLVSARLLARQSEPGLPADIGRQVAWRELARRLVRRRPERLLLYLLGIQISVQICGPYFNPYMLQQLRLSYARYMALVASAYVARIAALPLLGELARRSGARALLRLGGLGIVPLAALWMVSDAYPYLLALQLSAGTVWAAYELGMALHFLEAVAEEERTSILTSFNLANAIALAVGSLLGGLLLSRLGAGHRAYATLFALSSAARLLVVMLFWRMPLPVVGPLPRPLRLPPLRPPALGLDRPILPLLLALAGIPRPPRPKRERRAADAQLSRRPPGAPTPGDPPDAGPPLPPGSG
jgi:MFS family permease